MSENWYRDYFGGDDYNHNCVLRIFLEGPPSADLRFADEPKFKILDTSKSEEAPQLVDTEISNYQTWAWIEIKNEMRPKRLRLEMPPLIIDEISFDAPIISANYVHNIDFIPPSFNW